MTKFRHKIGCYSVAMSDVQADRWNRGEATRYDLQSVKVYVPGDGVVSLARATNKKLSPETYRALLGTLANKVE